MDSPYQHEMLQTHVCKKCSFMRTTNFEALRARRTKTCLTTIPADVVQFPAHTKQRLVLHNRVYIPY